MKLQLQAHGASAECTDAAPLQVCELPFACDLILSCLHCFCFCFFSHLDEHFLSVVLLAQGMAFGTYMPPMFGHVHALLATWLT